MRPASAKPRGRPRKKPEAETPQIAVVPFERSVSKHEKEEVPQVVRAPRVRSRSKHDETPQMPKAKARAKSRAKSPETPYVGPNVPLNPAADVLGGDEVPQFVAMPTAKPAKRTRKTKTLGLDASAPTILKPKLKVAAPVGEKRGRGRPRKVQIVEP